MTPAERSALVAVTLALWDAIGDDAHALTCSIQRGTSAPDPTDADANAYASDWTAIVTAAAVLGVTLPPDVTCLGWHKGDGPIPDPNALTGGPQH